MPALRLVNGKIVRRTTAPVTNCDNCAACCLHMGRPPFDPGEIDSLPAELARQIREYDADVAEGIRPDPYRLTDVVKELGFYPMDQDKYIAPCVWLDLETKRCIHYEHRPKTCRVMVSPGDPVCRASRNHFRIPLPTV